jgi:hypothetical protein
MKLKANSAPEFARLVENEILPLLRKQQGFLDQITFFVPPERKQALAISFWETKENFESYNRTGFPDVLKILAKVVEGTPEAETLELSSSTFHKLAAKGA